MIVTRFALRARRDGQDMRVSVLTVAGKGPRLRPAADDAPKSDDWRLSPLFQASKHVRTPGTPPPSGPLPDLFGTAGPTAIREYLGLVLTAIQAPVEGLVIESVQQPSQN